MAKSFDYKGLLYSPEVLGGIGLLTAGLSGKAPDTALPMMMQGMKTASMFSAMEKEEEKKRLIEQYADKVPEDQKALFKAFPEEWLKKYEFAKPSKPEFVNFKKGNDVVTLNVSNKDDLAKSQKLLSEGWTKITQAVQAGSLSELNKGTVGAAQKKIIGAEGLNNTLQIMDVTFEDDFLTYYGIGKANIAKYGQKLGFDIPKDIEGFGQRKARWEASVQQYFNNYRKEITGVAAGEKEIIMLEASIPNVKDSPAIFKAKIKLQRQLTDKIIQRNKLFLKEGVGAMTLDANGQPTGKYREFLLDPKNAIQPTEEMVMSMAKVYKDMGYPDSTIQFLLDKDFGSRDMWEKYFKQK